MSPLRLVIADEASMLRAGIRTTLDAEPDLTVVGEAADGVELLSLVRRLQPDVVLAQLRLPRCDGAQLATAVADAGWPVAVLLLATTAPQRAPARSAVDGPVGDPLVGTALRAGARGVLCADLAAAELLATVRAAAAGAVVLAPSVLVALLTTAGAPAGPPAEPPTEATGPTDRAGLTEREHDVLLELGRGHSNAEIAARLRVSETTVKTHVGRVLTKLRLRDRAQAVVFAYESGVIRPGGNSQDHNRAGALR